MLARLQAGARVAKADEAIEDLLDALARRFEPRLRDGFLSAVRGLAARLDAAAVRAAIGRGDTLEVMRLIGLADDGGAFAKLLDPLTQAARAGFGSLTQVPAVAEANVELLAGTPRTEATMRRYGLTLIREITEETRGAVAEELGGILRRGVNPREVATRIGNMVGLTRHQAGIVRRYREALVERDADALGRKLRDARFDATVRRAIRTGQPIDAAKLETLVRRYAERMRRMRGETIGRTESIRATQLGQHLGMRQAIDGGQLPEEGLTRRWVVARDERTCPTCKAIAKLNARGVAFEVPFQAPTGTVMRPPAHPNCRCVVTFRLAPPE